MVCELVCSSPSCVSFRIRCWRNLKIDVCSGPRMAGHVCPHRPNLGKAYAAQSRTSGRAMRPGG